MHLRIIAVLLLSGLIWLAAPARAEAPIPAKDTTAPVTGSAVGSTAQPAEAVNSVEGLDAVVIVVGLVVIALLIYLLTLGIPGKLLAIQNALGTPAPGGSVIRSLGQPAQEPDVAQALTQVQATLNQALQEIALIKGASETVLSQAWSRLAPGMPPPFAPQIAAIGQAHADGTVGITGRNFSPDCRVWFGVRDAQPEPGATANLLRVHPPAGQSGTVDVCIQSPSGLLSASRSWVYPVAAHG